MSEFFPADVELPTYSARNRTPDPNVSNSNGQEDRTEHNKGFQPNERNALSHTPKGHVELKQICAGRRVGVYPSAGKIMCGTDPKKDNYMVLIFVVKS